MRDAVTCAARCAVCVVPAGAGGLCGGGALCKGLLMCMCVGAGVVLFTVGLCCCTYGISRRRYSSNSGVCRGPLCVSLWVCFMGW